jgi:hypothetical protein
MPVAVKARLPGLGIVDTKGTLRLRSGQAPEMYLAATASTENTEKKRESMDKKADIIRFFSFSSVCSSSLRVLCVHI